MTELRDPDDQEDVPDVRNDPVPEKAEPDPTGHHEEDIA